MKRLALVVVFLGMLALIPAMSPGVAPYRPAPEPVVAAQPAPQPPEPVAAPPKPDAIAAAPSETQSAVSPDSAQPQPQTQTQTADSVETPGEQRTSSTARTASRPESIEIKVQKELVRMACYSGKQETGWGGRSRSALRRFTARARPKTGGVVSQGLLDIMAAYPANYCRLCRPGEKACDIGAGAKRRSEHDALPEAERRAEAIAPPNAQQGAEQVAILDSTTQDRSYLPPWMRGETETAEPSVEPAQNTQPEKARRKPVRKAQRRKATRQARFYRYQGRHRRLPGFFESAWFAPY